MKIAIALGSPDISGGTYVIFQHADFLASTGHDVTIFTRQRLSPDSARWHPAYRRLRLREWIDVAQCVERFDLAIATWWRTVFDVHEIPARRYAYFVQSIESRFYPEFEKPLRQLVESTYQLGLPVITEARWIQKYLREQHGVSALLARNGIDKNQFAAGGPQIEQRNPKGLRVLVEGPVDVAFKNVPEAIACARQADVAELWLLTSSKLRDFPGVDRVFSRVPTEHLGPIYRSCDVLVKLSYVEGMFGPPLEQFHCGGTAIVYDVTGADEYIVHEQNAIVVGSGDRGSVVEALRELTMKPERLRRLTEGALATAATWPSWREASHEFLAALTTIQSGPQAPDHGQLALVSEFHMQSYAIAENYRLALEGAATINATSASSPAPWEPTAQRWRLDEWSATYGNRGWGLLSWLDRRFPHLMQDLSSMRLQAFERVFRVLRRLLKAPRASRARLGDES